MKTNAIILKLIMLSKLAHKHNEKVLEVPFKQSKQKEDAITIRTVLFNKLRSMLNYIRLENGSVRMGP